MFAAFNVFLLVTISGCVLGQDATDRVIQSCYSTFIYGDTCPNYKGAIACIKKAPLVDNDSKLIVDEAVRLVEAESSHCPDICPEKDSQQCTKNVMKNYHTDKSCAEVDQALACLTGLKKKCKSAIIVRDIKEMQKVQKRCDAGLFKDGECHSSKWYQCTQKVYTNLSQKENGELKYDCDEKNVKAARKCLNDLGEKCTKDAHKAFYDETILLLNTACPKEE